MLTGGMTALITPMLSDGTIDTARFEFLIERQLKAGINALVVNGSTGESSTLTLSEQHEILKIALEVVNHRIPVIMGTGSNSTRQTIENTRRAKELGADTCLIVTPYYNRPSQAGLLAHYQAIAQAISIPIILYNVPSRTGCDLLPETVKKLAEIENIVALKECVLTLERIEYLVYHCGNKIDLISGNDQEALFAMRLGFKGVISAISNVVPELVSQLCQLALSSEVEKAQKLNQQLMPLHEALFIESNPIAIKWLLHERGLIQDGIRLPLLPLTEKYHQKVMTAFSKVQSVLQIPL